LPPTAKKLYKNIQKRIFLTEIKKRNSFQIISEPDALVGSSHEIHPASHGVDKRDICAS
jgi:hypothetical protein